MKRIVLTLLIFLIILTGWTNTAVGPPIPLELQTLPLTLNGVEYDATTSNYPAFLYSGMTYIPLTWEVTDALGLTLAWVDGDGIYIDTTGIGKRPRAPDAAVLIDTNPEAVVPAFNLYINGIPYENESVQYPILTYRDILYVPLTRPLAYDTFGWEFSYSADNGIDITVGPQTPAISATVDEPADWIDAFVIVFDDILDADEEEELQAIFNRLSAIPADFMEELNAYDVNMILTTGQITDIPEYVHLKGVVPRGWEATGRTWDDVPGIGGDPIVVRVGYSFNSAAHGSVNLELHEVAHGIDLYALDTVSDEEVFLDIWRKEASVMFADAPYMIDYAIEYFAEAFAYFYLNEDTNEFLKEKAPETWEFIYELDADDY